MHRLQIRNVLIILFLVQLTALSHSDASSSAHGQRNTLWSVGLQPLFFFDNTEYFNPYASGETLLGMRVRGTLRAKFRPLLCEVGAVLQTRYGRQPSLEYAEPWIRLSMFSGPWAMIAGALDASRHFEQTEALFFHKHFFTKPIYNGLQFRYWRHGLRAELWGVWHEINTPWQQESFSAGTSVSMQASWFMAAANVVVVHHGGQQFEKIAPVHNSWAGELLLHWRYQWAKFEEFRLGLHLLGSLYQPDIHAFELNEYGGGLEPRLEFLYHQFKAQASVYGGQDFYAAHGNPMYGTAMPFWRLRFTRLFKLWQSELLVYAELNVIEESLEYLYGMQWSIKLHENL